MKFPVTIIVTPTLTIAHTAGLTPDIYTERIIHRRVDLRTFTYLRTRANLPVWGQQRQEAKANRPAPASPPGAARVTHRTTAQLPLAAKASRRTTAQLLLAAKASRRTTARLRLAAKANGRIITGITTTTTTTGGSHLFATADFVSARRSGLSSRGP